MSPEDEKMIDAMVARVSGKIEALKYAALECVTAGAFEIKNKNPGDGLALIKLGQNALSDIDDYYSQFDDCNCPNCSKDEKEGGE